MWCLLKQVILLLLHCRYGPVEKQEILLKIEGFYVKNNNKCNTCSIINMGMAYYENQQMLCIIGLHSPCI